MKFIKIVSAALCILLLIKCGQNNPGKPAKVNTDTLSPVAGIAALLDQLPDDSNGRLIRYGKELMMHTVDYIGPEGSNGQYTGNKMNCTNCHQDGGTKPYSFSLMTSFRSYPQYRAREGRVLSLAERVNNCVMRPLNGHAIPENSREMQAFMAYYKWLDSQIPAGQKQKGAENLEIKFIDRAADTAKGAVVYTNRCARCHGINGEGTPAPGNKKYVYPLLWGDSAYQSGSSMHRITKMARWLKANMPYDSARWYNPVLSDADALDVAAFINDERIHYRPSPPSFDYPHTDKKPIDYGKGPFLDTFPPLWHQFGPFQPIIDYWKSKGWKPTY